MPFVSRSQQAWGNSPAGVKALGGPAKVAEWNASTKGAKLPKRIAKPRKLPKSAGHMVFGSLAPDGEDSQ